MRRRATISWLDRPPEGIGHVRVDSRAFTALPISSPGDDPPHPREVTPGELLAAAYGAMFLATLGELFEAEGIPARELVVEADCEVNGARLDHRLTALDLGVHGIVDGADEGRFEAAAGEALERLRDWLGLHDELPIAMRANMRGEVRRSG